MNKIVIANLMAHITQTLILVKHLQMAQMIPQEIPVQNHHRKLTLFLAIAMVQKIHPPLHHLKVFSFKLNLHKSN